MGLGGFFKGLGKAALKIAPVATMFIPGLQPLGAALMGAGLGAANAKVSGQGAKGVLLGAGLGAIPGVAKGIKAPGGFLGNGTGKVMSSVNANVVDGVKDVATKGLGGKLMDSLTSPEMIKAGIGAGLQGLFGDEGDKRQSFKNKKIPGNNPEVMLSKLRATLGPSALARINLTSRGLNNPGVPALNFQTRVPGLPFQVGIQNQGIQPTQARAVDPAMEELKKVLASLG
jgi:hypothetical protein